MVIGSAGRVSVKATILFLGFSLMCISTSVSIFPVLLNKPLIYAGAFRWLSLVIVFLCREDFFLREEETRKIEGR